MPAKTTSAVPTAAMIRANAALMSATARTMGHAALERNRKAWLKLEAQCRERGIRSIDIEDFAIVDGKVVRVAATP